jgi:hypothetical protein
MLHDPVPDELIVPLPNTRGISFKIDVSAAPSILLSFFRRDSSSINILLGSFPLSKRVTLDELCDLLAVDLRLNLDWFEVKSPSLLSVANYVREMIQFFIIQSGKRDTEPSPTPTVYTPPFPKSPSDARANAILKSKKSEQDRSSSKGG